MEFVWAGELNKKNSRICFELEIKKSCDTIVICAADFFRVFLDGQFVAYGPARTAAGYSKKRELLIRNVKNIRIEVLGYNVPCYACDFQMPFFAAEVKNGQQLVYTTEDFSCYKDRTIQENVPRYSPQRGFLEFYDFHNKGREFFLPYVVKKPIVLCGEKDPCDYKRVNFDFLGKSPFNGFEQSLTPYWVGRESLQPENGGFDVQKDFLDKAKIGYQAYDFCLERERTGFLQLKIVAKTDVEIFAVFDEVLPNGEWIFRRSDCNDLLVVTAPSGNMEVISFEPYAFRFLKLVVKGEAKIIPSLIALENNNIDFVQVSGNKKLTTIFDAAKNSFSQNALDVFMDCPGRERAGWLCDSYFTAQAELLFTGKNTIEKAFLENILRSETPEIPQGMFPKSFPSEHSNGLYIPNWGMWFVVELHDYLLRTGDRLLIDAAKGKVYDLMSFFDKYVNEYGLLEDLESWVFIEWSISNDKDYVKGVNFPSNMLFAYMLECVDALYGDKKLKERAENIRAAIKELSYDGEFYADNAIRQGGKLCRCDDHISETCQYYALFFGFQCDEIYIRKMIEEFGPLRTNGYPKVGKSNMFIGNYLRFFWLCEMKEYDRVLTEMTEYFYAMAKETGTLWEHDSSKASCNHGFASVAAVLILRCTLGYLTTREGNPLFENGQEKESALLKASFKYSLS